MSIFNKQFVFSACMVCCALGAASCTGDDGEDIPKYIAIDATIEQGMTRAVTNGNSMTFEPGDRLSLYVWTSASYAVNTEHMIVNGVVNTLADNGTWTPESQMLWADIQSRHYFLGIYPERTVTDFEADPYRLTGNYETDDLLAGSDLTGMTPVSNKVGLVFDHLMAKLRVNLIFRNEFEGNIAGATVTCQAADGCTINYLSRNCTPGEPARVALSSVTPVQGYDQTWQGIMIPQEGFRQITVTIEGKNFTYTHPTDITLMRGNITTASLIIGRNLIELGSVKIDGWESEYNLDGDAERIL